MSATLYLVNIDAEDEIKQSVKDFMGDMYPTDVAIKFGRDGFDLAFLTKKAEFLTALLEDAKETYNLEYSSDIQNLENSAFLEVIHEVAEYFGEEDDEFIEFFNETHA